VKRPSDLVLSTRTFPRAIRVELTPLVRCELESFVCTLFQLLFGINLLYVHDFGQRASITASGRSQDLCAALSGHVYQLTGGMGGMQAKHINLTQLGLPGPQVLLDGNFIFLALKTKIDIADRLRKLFLGEEIALFVPR
jgi:hypothetical protein